MGGRLKEKDLSPYLITPSASVVDAMAKIDENAKGLLFVVNEENILKGVITDGDIRRWLLKTGELQGHISDFMNTFPIVVKTREKSKAFELMEENKVTAIPVVTCKNKVVDIIFNSSNYADLIVGDELKDIPVVIMAGGKGTRLYPYTKILPKPLIPIGDIPIMERIINRFREFGVEEFYATVNYRKSMIKSYFADMKDNYTVNYVEEDKPLGTAGSLWLLGESFDSPFIVTNCDVLIKADYKEIYDYHVESGNELTMVSALKNIVVPYGVINSSENGAIESIDEKPKLSYFVNTGMYILNADIIKDIPRDTFFHMTDLADKLMKEGRKIGMYPISEESFLDMGEFEEMRRMEAKLNDKAEE